MIGKNGANGCAQRQTSLTWMCLLLITMTVVTLVTDIHVHCETPLLQLSSPPQKRAGSSAGGAADPKDYCNKTVEIYEDVASPEVTHLNRGRPLWCWYRFRSFRGAPRDWVIRLRFKKFKIGTLINATHCDGGFMQIVDGNAKTDVSNRREPGMFCGESEQPQTFLSETSYVKILFYAENFTDQTYFAFDSHAEQQMEVYLRYGQHPELYPNRRGEVVQGLYCEREFRDCRLQTCYVQSPAYPGIYPRALKCRYRLHTRNPFIKLYLQNEQFAVDGQRCENIMTCPMREIGSGNEHCPNDWLAVYDGRDEHAPLIGKFCGMGKFPFSIIGTSQHMFVEFVSSPAGPLLNTGFHFNVGNWPGHVETAGIKHGACDWLLTSDALKVAGTSEGIFLSVAHWYPPNTSCTYHIQGAENEIVRLYFPSFRINRIEAAIQKYDDDCAESLTIYDSNRADPARIIKTFCDTFSRPMEKVDFVSTGRSLYVRFESRTGSYSGSSLYYWAHYDFFNDTRFGEPVPNTLCDETFYAWKHGGGGGVTAGISGRIRSPLNTLIYKRTSGSDVRCQYRFVTDKRLAARVIVEVTDINFKELPYNTNTCTRCIEERADKVIVWEERDKQQNHLACFCDTIPRPVRVISSGEQMNLEMIVQGQHSMTSYFKYAPALFEANYEFAHGPICGPITYGPSNDGELVFPHRNALRMITASAMSSAGGREEKREKCIWELRVAAQRDLWLHLDKARFTDRSCTLGRIDVYLAGRLEPRFTICPDNVSLAKDLPILSAAELGALDNENEPLPVLIQYTGDSYPGRNAFRLVWTELFHLPRNADGTLSTLMLQDNECFFKCPGPNAVCIPKHLVCNGIVNCPNVTMFGVNDRPSSTVSTLNHGVNDNNKEHGDVMLANLRENLKRLNIDETVIGDSAWDSTTKANNPYYYNYYYDDESPIVCIKSTVEELPYIKVLLLGSGICLAIALFIAILCLMCRKRKY